MLNTLFTKSSGGLYKCDDNLISNIEYFNNKQWSTVIRNMGTSNEYILFFE